MTRPLTLDSTLTLALRRGRHGCCPACGAELDTAHPERCRTCGTALDRANLASVSALVTVPLGLVAATLIVVAMEKIGGFPMWLEVAAAEGVALLVGLLALAPVRGFFLGLAYATRVEGFADVPARRPLELDAVERRVPIGAAPVE